MDASIFMDKTHMPDDDLLKAAIPKHFQLWQNIKSFIVDNFPSIIEEWTYPGKKYGWSFRMKSKKRTVMYFLPRDNYFKTAFVFGQKAYDVAMESDIPAEIKNELKNAVVYAEGRGFRFDAIDDDSLETIKKLIRIKMAN